MAPTPLPDDERAKIDAHLADLRAVGGDALVRRILTRFDQQLAEAADLGEAAWTRAFAHRTAGLAGMIGLEGLAAAARAVETSDETGAASPEQRTQAAAATAAALAEIRGRLAALS